MARRTKFVTAVSSTGLLLATTIGAGVFALPSVFNEAGWAIGAGHLVVLSLFVVFAHYLYWRVLDEHGGSHHHLMGLVHHYLGKPSSRLALVAVLGGLALSLVAYLILANTFLRLLTPFFSWERGVMLFWVIGSLPLLVRRDWLVDIELLGSVLMAGLVAFIFVSAGSWGDMFAARAADWSRAVVPFGPILFALAGWTAVPAMFDYERSSGRRRLLAPLWWGTLLAALLYALFVMGIFGSGSLITADTISGLSGWSAGGLAVIGLLGIFAMWTSYVPIALEIKDSLVADLGWSPNVSLVASLFVPLALVFSGLREFLVVISLAGGVFLSVQYLLILLVADRALRLRGWRNVVLRATIAVFGLAALYEIASFVLP